MVEMALAVSILSGVMTMKSLSTSSRISTQSCQWRINKLVVVVQALLDSIVTKCKERGLKLNISKTKYMENMTSFQQTCVQPTSSFRYLRCLLSSEWDNKEERRADIPSMICNMKKVLYYSVLLNGRMNSNKDNVQCVIKTGFRCGAIFSCYEHHVYHQETQAGVCWTRYEKKKVLYLAEYYVSQNPRQKRFRKTTHDLADPGDPSLGKLT